MASKKKIHPLVRHLKRAHEHVRDHFIPHKRNNYKPHALKHHVLVGYSVILILLKVLVIVAPIALPSSSLYSSAITPQNIVDLTNQARENLGLPALATDQKLMTAAADKANDMLANQYFAHTSPAGVTPWDWFTKVGYAYLYAGENLAVHFVQAEDVQAGWMASPTHRANIVNTNYTQIGVGVANGSFEGVPSTFVVEEFGQPVSTVTEASAPPTSTATPTRVATVETVPEVSSPTVKSAQKTLAPKPSAPPASTPVVKPTPAPAPAPLSSPTVVTSTPTQTVSEQTNTAPQQTTLADASRPVVQKVVADPTIDESSFSALPVSGGYQVRLVVTNATSVEAILGDARVALSQLGNSNTWQGILAVAPNNIAKGGESLTVLAANDAGRTASSSLAIVAPNTDTQQLYIFDEGVDRFTTILGFLRISNLNDSVRRIYVEFIVFLSAALLIYLFASRLTTRRLSVVGHAVGVMALAVILFVI